VLDPVKIVTPCWVRLIVSHFRGYHKCYKPSPAQDHAIRKDIMNHQRVRRHWFFI